MKYNPAIHNRRSIRLKTYDYSKAGLYFITICVQNRELLFGEIENNVMILNDAGKMIYAEWEKLPERFTNIQLHEFVVMPNHFHGIIEIVGAPLVGAHDTRKDNDKAIESSNESANDSNHTPSAAMTQRATTGPTPTDLEIPVNNTVGEMIGAFKSITTVEYIKGVKNSGWRPFEGKLWQRNYFEHLIRNEDAYKNIADYILNNPYRWLNDKFYRI